MSRSKFDVAATLADGHMGEPTPLFLDLQLDTAAHHTAGLDGEHAPDAPPRRACAGADCEPDLLVTHRLTASGWPDFQVNDVQSGRHRSKAGRLLEGRYVRPAPCRCIDRKRQNVDLSRHRVDLA